MSNISYHCKDYSELTPQEWQQISVLSSHVFDMPMTHKKISQKGACVITYAQQNDQILGFKIGHAENNKRFYSWLGCVSDKMRGKGIGAALMQHQHQYCINKNFSQITTKTMNKWRGMLLLNIKMGFDVVGVTIDGHGDLKIHLSKNL